MSLIKTEAVRPMLAQAITFSDLVSLRYPLGVQTKYDGIRGILLGGSFISRSGKLLPNHYVQAFAEQLYKSYPQLEGLDGEFIVGEANAPQVCMTTTSGIMSQAGEPNFTFHAFDLANPQYAKARYEERLRYMIEVVKHLPGEFRQRIQPVDTHVCHLSYTVISIIDRLVGAGHEGAILRDMNAPYKFGRSTLKQGYLLKFKDIRDDEAIIVGFEELYSNQNEAFKDDLGFTKRSAHQDNKVPMNILGALVVVNPRWPQGFRIGTGFDVETRKRIWNNQPIYHETVVKFKYLAAGMKDLPRHPSFLDFRSIADIDAHKLEGLLKTAQAYAAK